MDNCWFMYAVVLPEFRNILSSLCEMPYAILNYIDLVIINLCHISQNKKIPPQISYS